MKKNEQKGWNTSKSNILEDIKEGVKILRIKTKPPLHYFISQAEYDFLKKMKAIKYDKK